MTTADQLYHSKACLALTSAILACNKASVKALAARNMQRNLRRLAMTIGRDTMRVVHNPQPQYITCPNTGWTYRKTGEKRIAKAGEWYLCRDLCVGYAVQDGARPVEILERLKPKGGI